MAERQGFEPWVPRKRDTAFPVLHIRPLCHLSASRPSECAYHNSPMQIRNPKTAEFTPNTLASFCYRIKTNHPTTTNSQCMASQKKVPPPENRLRHEKNGRTSGIRFGFGESPDFFAFLVLAPFFQQVHTFVALQYVAMFAHGALCFQTWMQRHKKVSRHALFQISKTRLIFRTIYCNTATPKIKR